MSEMGERRMRRAFILLVVLDLFAQGPGNAQGETDEKRLVLLRTPTGYMIVGNESKAHFTINLPGQQFKPSKVEGMAFLLDGHLYQILLLDPAVFAAGEVSAKVILDRFMQYEASHWKNTLGVELPSVIQERADSPERAFMLWEIQWTEKARQVVKGNVVKQMFLSALAGDRILVVSRTVTEAEDSASALSDLSAAARSLVVNDFPTKLDAIKNQNRGER